MMKELCNEVSYLVIDLTLRKDVLKCVNASFLLKWGPAKPSLKDGSIIKRPKSVKYFITEAARAMSTGLFCSIDKTYVTNNIANWTKYYWYIPEKNLNGKGITKKHLSVMTIFFQN